MKSSTKCIRFTGIAALALFAVASASAQIPHYTNGMTGTFGSAGNWNYNSDGMTLNSTDDEYSARFTAFESPTVNGAWQRYVGMEAGTTIRLGIMADDGSGNPSGTYLASGTLTFTTSATFITNVTFGASVTLSSGSVYHLVTQVPTIVGDFFPRVGGSEIIRPYDRAVDTNMTRVLRRFNGGAWSPLTVNPYFALANGSTIIGGPGQPVGNTASRQFTTTGGNGTATGERFTIFDKEIPAGLWVAVTNLNIVVEAGGSPTADLLLRFREANGTILATATLPPALADGTTLRTLRLDRQIELQQGVPYLLTSEFGGPSVASQIYRFEGVTQTGGPGFGEAGWGGTNYAFAIRSLAANNWLTYTFDGGRTHTDLAFSFQGLVVPEPSSVALLGLGSMFLLCWRRRAR